MWWSIRNQILVPFAGIVLIAMLAITVTAAVLAARRSEQETVRQLQQVAETLDQASFPLSQNVLEKLRGLTGAEFVAFGRQGSIVASTMDESLDFARLPEVRGFNLETFNFPTMHVGDTDYFTATLKPSGSSNVAALVILYPETSWQESRWEAAFPPLVVGAATMILMVAVSVWLARRISRRIRSLEQQVASIAKGDFRQIKVAGPADEVQRLVCSVNHLSDELQRMQDKIRRTERTSLLAQLASGLAHQLRNAVAGARLAVQIHQKRCGDSVDGESLNVALQQLTLTEEQVKGLLSLGRHEQPGPREGDLITVIDEVVSLVGPMCQHARVILQNDTQIECPASVPDRDGVRMALLNLVLNAIEAAGSDGSVLVTAAMNGRDVLLEVRDTGDGPPADVSEQLFESFVTSKTEGVGLGLAIAFRVATELGGELSWCRNNGQTVFALKLPVTVPDSSTIQPSIANETQLTT